MLKTTLKDIRALYAVDVTTADAATLDAIRAADDFQRVAVSVAACGVSGLVVLSGGELYKVTARSSSLFYLL